MIETLRQLKAHIAITDEPRIDTDTQTEALPSVKEALDLLEEKKMEERVFSC